MAEQAKPSDELMPYAIVIFLLASFTIAQILWADLSRQEFVALWAASALLALIFDLRFTEEDSLTYRLVFSTITFAVLLVFGPTLLLVGLFKVLAYFVDSDYKQTSGNHATEM